MARIKIDEKKDNVNVNQKQSSNQWDSRLVDAYMRNQSKSNASGSTQSRLPQIPDWSKTSRLHTSDASSRYESIPNYNVLERTFSRRKRNDYNYKQALMPLRQEQQRANIGSTLSHAGVTSDDLKALSAGTYGNSVFQGLDVLQGLRTLNQKKKVAQKIKDIGLSASDVLEYAQQMNRANEQKQAVDFADRHKILGTAATFPINAAGGIAGGVANTADYLVGKPIDPNSFANSYANASNAMRGAVSDDFGKTGQLLYNVGTSIGDSATAMALAAGNPTVAGGIQGLNSYNNSIIDTANRGLSPDQIMATSTIAGLAEGAFEAIPLGKLKSIFTGSKEVGESVIKSVLKQMANEGASEMTTEVINQAADRIINGGLSNYVQAVETYQKNGMSEETAKKQAWNDIGKQVVYSGLAGAISGGIMGGGAAIAGKVIGNRPSVNTDNSDVSAVNTDSTSTLLNGTESLEDTAIKAGKATTIYSPYSGEVPTQKTQNTNRVEVSQESYNNAVSNMQTAGYDSSFTGKNIRKILTKVYENIFSGGSTSKDVVVNGTEFGANPYTVTVNKNAVSKIMSDPNLSAEKISVIDNIENVIGNSNYVGSGNYVAHGSRNNAAKVTRYDYFETPVTINGNNYIVSYDVEVYPDRNNYRTHKVINEMSLTEAQDTGPVPAATNHVTTQAGAPTNSVSDLSSNSFTNNIPNSTENVQYNSKKIDGFNDLDKALDRLVGMYKGNENTASMYADMKSAINEYLRTGNQSAIDRAVTLAANIDESLQGHSYTRKGNGKKTVKATNSRLTTQFSEGEFVDTLMSYGRYLRDAAKSNSANTNQQTNIDVQNASQQNNQQINQNIVPPQQPTSQNTDQSGNQRKRSYNDTLVNKTDAPQALKNEFIANPDMYTQLSNAETAAKADSILANNDINSAMAQFRQMLDAKDPTAVPLGYNISKKLSEAGRVDEAVQIVRDMSKSLTESGQFSQAAAITMLNNDPQAALRYLVREIDSVNEAGKTKFKDKWNDFELTDSEVQQFNSIDPGDTEAIKAAYEKVYDRLRKEYPVTMTEKLMELRRISMLLNARTNVRNVVSNALIMPVRWTADRVTALGEGAYKLIHPEYEGTQSANPVRSKESRKLAAEAFETVKSELLGDSKYNDVNGAVRDKQVFKGNDKAWKMCDNVLNGALSLVNKIIGTDFDTTSRKITNLDIKANQKMGKNINASLLETARNFTYYLLEKGDDVFVKKNFESRMASYLDAQGITDLESIPADAYTLATQEAYKATFKDDTKLATIFSDVRRTLGVPGDIVMPFTKTPANIAMRGIDYSPAGVANALVKLKNAKSNAEVSSALTLLGQGATGTAAIAVGYALAQSGVIQGALSDDKDEAQWEKSHGKLAYSFQPGKIPFLKLLGDNYYTFDWAQPASIPLILGATIYQCQKDSDSALDTIYQGAVAATNAWSDLSPLQTLTDIFGGNGTPAENIANTLLESPLGWIPAQLGATARIDDTTQRVTYDNTSKLQNIINQAKSKIPGLSQTLPVAYDTWGNPIKRQDTTAEAAFANLLNPGQLGNSTQTPIDDEITNLYNATGDAAVFPKKASWSYKINGETVKLNSEQYSEYQRVMGSNAYNMASALINSDSYANMSDDQKAGAISDLYNFADALAKSELLGFDIESSQTYKKMYEIYQDKGAAGVATYLGIKQSMTGTKAEDKVSAVADLNASDEEKGYYLSLLVGDLSKDAQTAFDYNGYPGVYWYYAQKTGIGDYSGLSAARKQKIQAMIDGTYEDPMTNSHEENQAKIRAMLDGTYDSTYVTSENMSNRDKIEAMLNGTYTNQDSEYQRRLQKIRDMLK